MQMRLDVKMFDGGVTYTDMSADLAQICVEKCSAVSVYGFEKQDHDSRRKSELPGNGSGRVDK